MTRRRAALGVLILVCFFALFLAGARELARARRWQTFGRLVYEVPRRDSVVALTIDDGPIGSVAGPIADTLRAHDARATFFVTGRELAEDSAAGTTLIAAGHELGNHTWSHQRMWFVSPGRIRDEVERTDALIHHVGQRGPILFRPPFAYKLVGLPWYLSRTNRTTVTWSIEPDSYDFSAAEMVRHVMTNVKPGSIILLHVWYPSRASSFAALGPMIDSLHVRGYRVTTVRDLLLP